MDIPQQATVKITKTKAEDRILYSTGNMSGLPLWYKRINKTKWVDLRTNTEYEIKKQSKSREENIQAVKKTVEKIRDIINCNFTGEKNELFITLTYAENMTDTKRLYLDMDKFIKKMKYKYGDIKYICVIEPQERGAWHCHILIKFLEEKSMFINNSDTYVMWGEKGFTKTQTIKSIRNIGLYVSAYLTDILDEEGSKKKGQRLKMYPTGINIYRASRNIEKPKIYQDTYENYKKKSASAKADKVTHSTHQTKSGTDVMIISEYYRKNKITINGKVTIDIGV